MIDHIDVCFFVFVWLLVSYDILSGMLMYCTIHVYIVWIVLNNFIYAYHSIHRHVIYFGPMQIYEIGPDLFEL